MKYEKFLDLIKEEFLNVLAKNQELLDEISELQGDIKQLNRDLEAYRSLYPMKNEVCGMCIFADECIDENRVEGKALCSSFHAKKMRRKRNED